VPAIHPDYETHADLVAAAFQHRDAGEFATAASLFRRAAHEAPSSQEMLFLRLRYACCLDSATEHAEIAEAARQVAEQARAEGHYAELADALGLIVDNHMQFGRVALAADALADASYALELAEDGPELYLPTHNLAITFARWGSVDQALELFDRALRMAPDAIERYRVHANSTTAYSTAAVMTDDPIVRHELLTAGIAAASLAVDDTNAYEIAGLTCGLAHRSILRLLIGDYEAAINDARRAEELSAELGMFEERSIALISGAAATWLLHRDPASALPLAVAAQRFADEHNLSEFVQLALEAEVDILWQMGAFEEARALLEVTNRNTLNRLQRERLARIDHVQLGVNHRRTSAESETDSLTGLRNRRYLSRTLHTMLQFGSPVAICVLDLDGFKQINDLHSYALGDQVLQEVAGLLNRACRRADAVIRLGGDEFLLALRDTDLAASLVVLERARELIRSQRFAGLGDTVRLTASVGVTVGQPGDDPLHVVAIAQESLQRAKRSGRNCIVVA
jgi:diguanylate cyclase (GGDEF)-like protein